MEHIEAHSMRLLGTVPADTMSSSAVHFWPADVLYGRLRPYLNKVYRPSFEGLCSGEFIVFPASPHFSASYLQYFLNSAEFVSFSSHLNTGDRPRVDFEQIGEYSIPLPPLAEQHRIVAEIEKHLTRLDAAVAALERTRANLKRYRASVLKAAVEGRLWQAETVRHLGTAQPALPAGWAWRMAETLCGFITKGTTPSAAKLYAGEGEVPFIKVYNLTNRGMLDFTVNPTFVSKETHSKELKRSRVVPGDVLMNIVGPPLGKVSLVPDDFAEWNVNQAIAIFRPKEGFDRRFLALCLQSETVLSWALRRAKATAGQSNLTLQICRELPLPVPPLTEQHRIVAEVERRVSVIDNLAAAVETALRGAERLRQSVLKHAFEGRLVPQDPNDEPASVLLDRIRGERALAQSPARSRSRFVRQGQAALL